MAWFWKKPKIRDLKALRASTREMARALLDASGIEFDRATQLEQALVGTFFFGMIHAEGMLHELTPAEVHALAIAIFIESLHYSPQAAAEGVQECINAATPNYHPTMNAILHRGIDGHQQFLAKDIDGLSQNIRSVLEQFRPAGA